MKHLICASLAAGLAGTAMAQSEVTVYGVIDGGVRYLTNTNADGDSRLTLGSNGVHTANRIGFKGVEDLGGGWNAHFVLETGFNSGTGALDNTGGVLFNRTASVGIGGAWGSLDLGRQYNVAFKTVGVYEPFNYRYPSITLSVQGTAGVRHNNSLQYVGNFGPVTARAEYALGEVAGSTRRGSAMAVGAGYAFGPANIAGAYTKKTTADGFDYRHYTVGGDYKLGGLRLIAGYADETQETAAADTTNKYGWIGASYAFTPALTLTSAYYRIKNRSAAGEGEKDLYMLVATYALSKRTTLYAGVDRHLVEGTLIPAATGQSGQTGVTVGMNHFF